MRLEGEWLSSENFMESARLWLSRYAPENNISKETLVEVERDVIQIATRVAADEKETCDGAPLTCLFLDIPTVNYAPPLSVLALSASLEALSNGWLDPGDLATTDAAKPLRAPACSAVPHAALECDPTSCKLLCGLGKVTPLALTQE